LNKPTADRETGRIKSLLEDLKIQLRQRGAKGFIGLQRKFRIMDDDGDRALSYLEFKKAMKECALNLTDEVRHLLQLLGSGRMSEVVVPRTCKCCSSISIAVATEWWTSTSSCTV
jgi:hypothetical protein